MNKKNTNFKTFKIQKSLHEKVSKFCNDNGLVMYKWIEKILLENINKFEENKNVQTRD